MIIRLAERRMLRMHEYIATQLLAQENAMGQYNRISDAILTLDSFPDRFALCTTIRQTLIDICPLGTPGFERYGQNERCIKGYAKNVRIIYHITVWNKRVNEMEQSYLIKDTTKQERIALIKAWLPDDDYDDSGMDLWDIYADYINGTREIAEINASMSGKFYEEKDL